MLRDMFYLDPETLYVVDDPKMFAASPDGVGCYWWDTKEEAEQEMGPFKCETHFDTEDDFEDFRAGIRE